MDHLVNMQQSAEHEAFRQMISAMIPYMPDYSQQIECINARLAIIEEALAPQIELVKKLRKLRRNEQLYEAAKRLYPNAVVDMTHDGCSVTVSAPPHQQ